MEYFRDIWLQRCPRNIQDSSPDVTQILEEIVVVVLTALKQKNHIT